MKETLGVVGQGSEAAAILADRNYNKAIFNNCIPISGCIREINNTQVENTKDLDVVMPMYNLIEYSNNYPKTSVSLC